MPSRHCPDGHPNPPLADVCRVCGDAIHTAAPTVAIVQPLLGRLVLDDGEESAIDRALVLGRRPDAAVVGMPAGSRLIAVGSAATVSRTHVRIDVPRLDRHRDGLRFAEWDGGADAGTVRNPAPRTVGPHEVPINARVFLGGPTTVSIEAAGGAAQ